LLLAASAVVRHVPRRDASSSSRPRPERLLFRARSVSTRPDQPQAESLHSHPSAGRYQAAAEVLGSRRERRTEQRSGGWTAIQVGPRCVSLFRLDLCQEEWIDALARCTMAAAGQRAGAQTPPSAAACVKLGVRSRPARCGTVRAARVFERACSVGDRSCENRPRAVQRKGVARDPRRRIGFQGLRCDNALGCAGSASHVGQGGLTKIEAGRRARSKSVRRGRATRLRVARACQAQRHRHRA
jgi:hypothetical protein